jgi:hypothetical protein
MLMMSRSDQHNGSSRLVGADAVAVLLGKSVRTVNRFAEDGVEQVAVMVGLGVRTVWALVAEALPNS